MSVQVIQARLRQQYGMGYDDNRYEPQAQPEFTEESQETIQAKNERLKNIRSLKRTLKINDFLAALTGMFGLFVAIYEYENFYDDTTKAHFSSDNGCYVMRSVVSLTTGCLLVLVVVHSYIAYRIDREKKPVDLVKSYGQSIDFKVMLVELFLNLVHCPPGVDYKFSVTQLGAPLTYSFDTIALEVMYIRIYLIVRVFAHLSKWTSEMAEECCEPEGCEAGTVFALKAVFKDKPYATLLTVMIVSIIVFGLAVRGFERPYYYGWDPTTSGFQDYSYIWNGMWLVAITMTTVGYGDFFPKTHMGRFVIILACFWGVFLVSMMVVTLTISSSFEPKEAKAYDILFRLNIKEQIKKSSSYIVVLGFRLVGLNINLKKSKITQIAFKEMRLKYRNELQIRLEEFKQVKSQLSEYEISAEELLRQLSEKIDKDFDDIKDILLSLVAIEKQMDEIEKSQAIVISALNESQLFTNNLQDHLANFKPR